MTFALIVGAVGVGLAFLMADFAERIRLWVYEYRDREAPENQLKRYLTGVLAVFFVAWSFVAYL
jgi:hypothetical protein